MVRCLRWLLFPVLPVALTLTQWSFLIPLALHDNPQSSTILVTQPEHVTKLAYSPDGSMFAIATQGGKVIVYSASLLTPIFSPPALNGTIRGLAFSRDSRYLAAAPYPSPWGDDYQVRIWDVITGVEVWRSPDDILSPSRPLVFGLDGQTLYTTTGRTIYAWDVNAARHFRTLSAYIYGLSSIALSPNGELLALGVGTNGRSELYPTSGYLGVWETTSGVERFRYMGHDALVAAVAFSPDSRLILTGSADYTARLIDALTGIEIRRFEGHTEQVNGVAFLNGTDLIVTGGWDNLVCLWNYQTGEQIACRGAGALTDLAAAPDGQSFLVSFEDYTVRRWNTMSFTDSD